MYVQGSPETKLVSSVVRFLEYIVVGVLALAALGWIIERNGDQRKAAARDDEIDMVVVHVTEPDVEVVVGTRTYRIEGMASAPIRCELPDGSHDLIVTRDGRLLYKQTFTVRSGESIVLTAWDPNRTREQVSEKPRP
jgi:hypothetical protein